MQSNSGCFAIIVNTITTKKRGKIIVKRFVFFFASPALHQHVQKEGGNPATSFNQSVFVRLSVFCYAANDLYR